MRRSENRSRPSGRVPCRIAALGHDVPQRHAPSRSRISAHGRFRRPLLPLPAAHSMSIPLSHWSVCLEYCSCWLAICRRAYHRIIDKAIRTYPPTPPFLNTRAVSPSTHAAPHGKIPSHTKHMAPLSLILYYYYQTHPFHLYVSSFLPASHSPSIPCLAITSSALHSQTRDEPQHVRHTLNRYRRYRDPPLFSRARVSLVFLVYREPLSLSLPYFTG